jgi:hypothetical protein
VGPNSKLRHPQCAVSGLLLGQHLQARVLTRCNVHWGAAGSAQVCFPGNPTETSTHGILQHKDLYQRVPSLGSCNWKITWNDSHQVGVTIPLFDDKTHMQNSSVVVWGKSASIETHADIAKWTQKISALLTMELFLSGASALSTATCSRANYKLVEHIGRP